MKTTFIEFITESKNYPIFKGVNNLDLILTSGVFRDSGDYESTIRKNMGIENGISVTRFFNFAKGYGDTVIEFDTQKLSDKYKIVPFSENPDYHLWYLGDTWQAVIKSKSPKNPKNGIKNSIKDKDFDEEYWNYKTNKNAGDFGIAEEIILTKEISIRYIKKVYLLKKNNKIEKLLDERNIPYEYIDNSTSFSDIKYKDIKGKKLKPVN